MILTYEAIDSNGRRKTDTVEAADAQEAVAQLRRDGLYVTTVTEASGRNKGKTRPGRRSSDVDRRAEGLLASGNSNGAIRLPLTTLVLLTRQMTMLLRAGASVVPAITSIKRQMKKPAHVALLGQVANDLEEGVTLTDALGKHPKTFDATYCAIVAAGEASATLPDMFERLSSMIRKRRVLRNKVLGALAYPALLIVMSFTILLSLLFFVIPRFHDMFTQLAVDPPASTKLLLATGNILSEHWLAVGSTAIALLVGTAFALNSSPGRQWISNMQIRIPIVGRLRSHLIQAQLLRTMGTLMESRVGVLEALGLVRDCTRNDRFQKLFEDLESNVTSGGNIVTAFEDSGMVEAYVCQAIQTGEESGSVGEAMNYAAEILDETNTELINTVMRLIEPMILICMGFVVGGVAISLFLPLFDLTAAIQ